MRGRETFGDKRETSHNTGLVMRCENVKKTKRYNQKNKIYLFI